jgi:hypothetical protein
MEPIKMVEQHLNLFPAKFNWNGQLYRVDAVNECKTTTSTSGRIEAYHFWVGCAGKRLHLSHHLATGQWLLQQN